MSSMTQVRLAVVLLIAAAVLANGAATALGAGGPLTPTGDEPNASGTVNFTGLKYASTGEFPYVYYSCNLSVTCGGLTPGAVYAVNYLGRFTADANGNGAIKGRIYVRAQLITLGKKRNVAFDWVYVAVQQDGGPTVLEGIWYPR
jgi:hypothetical protein